MVARGRRNKSVSSSSGGGSPAVRRPAKRCSPGRRGGTTMKTNTNKPRRDRSVSRNKNINRRSRSPIVLRKTTNAKLAAKDNEGHRSTNITRRPPGKTSLAPVNKRAPARSWSVESSSRSRSGKRGAKNLQGKKATGNNRGRPRSRSPALINSTTARGNTRGDKDRAANNRNKNDLAKTIVKKLQETNTKTTKTSHQTGVARRRFSIDNEVLDEGGKNGRSKKNQEDRKRQQATVQLRKRGRGHDSEYSESKSRTPPRSRRQVVTKQDGRNLNYTKITNKAVEDEDRPTRKNKASTTVTTSRRTTTSAAVNKKRSYSLEESDEDVGRRVVADQRRRTSDIKTNGNGVAAGGIKEKIKNALYGARGDIRDENKHNHIQNKSASNNIVKKPRVLELASSTSESEDESSGESAPTSSSRSAEQKETKQVGQEIKEKENNQNNHDDQNNNPNPNTSSTNRAAAPSPSQSQQRRPRTRKNNDVDFRSGKEEEKQQQNNNTKPSGRTSAVVVAPPVLVPPRTPSPARAKRGKSSSFQDSPPIFSGNILLEEPDSPPLFFGDCRTPVIKKNEEDQDASRKPPVDPRDFPGNKNTNRYNNSETLDNNYESNIIKNTAARGRKFAKKDSRSRSRAQSRKSDCSERNVDRETGRGVRLRGKSGTKPPLSPPLVRRTAAKRKTIAVVPRPPTQREIFTRKRGTTSRTRGRSDSKNRGIDVKTNLESKKKKNNYRSVSRTRSRSQRSGKSDLSRPGPSWPDRPRRHGADVVPPKGNRPKSASADEGRNYLSVLVRHLPTNVKMPRLQDDLTEKFERYGKLRDVYIPLDYSTKEPKGFAYVKFCNKDSAETAINELDGAKLKGHVISCEVAEDRRKRPGEMQRIAEQLEKSRQARRATLRGRVDREHQEEERRPSRIERLREDRAVPFRGLRDRVATPPRSRSRGRRRR
ncbi:unnamed protein product [Amoebophrya sp. A120]|nr:unnamed protein product [Amoebophrya sp. A120]|eukprot:GSA120T00007223001.1